MAGLKYTGNNPMFNDIFSTIIGHVDTYSDLKTKVSIATEGKETAIADFLKVSTHPEIVKLRDAVNKAQEKMTAIAEKELTSKALSGEELEKAKTDMNTAREEARTGISAVEGVLNFVKEEAAATLLEEIKEIVKSTRGRQPGSKNTGENLPKVAVNVTINGGNLKNAQYPTLSAAAKVLSLEVKDLQLAMATAAGVEHANLREVKTPQKFDVTPVAGGSTYTIITTPKETQKPGRKPGQTNAASTSAETPTTDASAKPAA